MKRDTVIMEDTLEPDIRVRIAGEMLRASSTFRKKELAQMLANTSRSQGLCINTTPTRLNFCQNVFSPPDHRTVKSASSVIPLQNGISDHVIFQKGRLAIGDLM